MLAAYSLLARPTSVLGATQVCYRSSVTILNCAGRTCPLETRPLGREEGLLYRDLRLRALADSPDAFGETLSQAQARSEGWWIRGADYIANHSDRLALFIAWDNQVPCGSIYISLESSVAHIFGMWAEPAYRRRGIGTALLNTATPWAIERQAVSLDLWVTEGNEAAMRLYQRAQFSATGEQDLLRPDSSLRICRMVRSLANQPY